MAVAASDDPVSLNVYKFNDRSAAEMVLLAFELSKKSRMGKKSTFLVRIKNLIDLRMDSNASLSKFVALLALGTSVGLIDGLVKIGERINKHLL